MIHHAVRSLLFRLVTDIFSVILIHRVLAGAVQRPELHNALRPVNRIRSVVLLIHGKDGHAFYEHRQFPAGNRKVIEHLSPLISLTRQIVRPHLLLIGKIDAVSHIIPRGICRNIFIHGSNEKTCPKHELILHLPGSGISVSGIFQEHGPHHGKPLIFIPCIQIGSGSRTGVDIGHELCLDLHIHTVNPCVGISERIRRLHIAAPPVHIQHLGSKCLPLVIPYCDQGSAAEDPVHIAADIRIAA